jgi:hypothetical protein
MTIYLSLVSPMFRPDVIKIPVLVAPLKTIRVAVRLLGRLRGDDLTGMQDQMKR